MTNYRILSSLDPSDYPTNKVAVAMSGGVDSSLAAVLLKERGFDVIGLTMALWDYESCGGRGNQSGCCDLASIESARTIAGQAGFPHYVTNLKKEFETAVIDDFVASYISGRTPNPCVVCNTEMKWKFLFRKARSLGYDLLATGHYARIGTDPSGQHFLFKGKDPKKDQSYFLWGIAQENLAGTLFPLGGLTKLQTRAESGKRGLASTDRPESFEICFVPDNDYHRFLKERLGTADIPVLREGDILDRSGRVVGKHRGTAFYTIGQRKGIGAFGVPAYIVAIDHRNNTMTIGDRSGLLSPVAVVREMNWFLPHAESGKIPCTVRIRSTHPGVESLATVTVDGAVVEFGEPQPAVTPGQSAVLYDGDLVIGGGIIEK